MDVHADRFDEGVGLFGRHLRGRRSAGAEERGGSYRSKAERRGDGPVTKTVLTF